MNANRLMELMKDNITTLSDLSTKIKQDLPEVVQAQILTHQEIQDLSTLILASMAIGYFYHQQEQREELNKCLKI